MGDYMIECFGGRDLCHEIGYNFVIFSFHTGYFLKCLYYWRDLTKRFRKFFPLFYVSKGEEMGSIFLKFQVLL